MICRVNNVLLGPLRSFVHFSFSHRHCVCSEAVVPISYMAAIEVGEVEQSFYNVVASTKMMTILKFFFTLALSSNKALVRDER